MQMDEREFRLKARDVARVAVSQITERDIRIAKKATCGYDYLMRELDGLLDCLLNGLNDHLLPELHEVLDAIQFLNKASNEESLPPKFKKIMQEEFDDLYEHRFGNSEN